MIAFVRLVTGNRQGRAELLEAMRKIEADMMLRAVNDVGGKGAGG